LPPQYKGWAAGKKVEKTAFKKAVNTFLDSPMGAGQKHLTFLRLFAGKIAINGLILTSKWENIRKKTKKCPSSWTKGHSIS
jgi:hypothetical protein